VGIAIQGTKYGRNRLGGGEDQRQLEPREHAAQPLIDRPRELALPGLLALGALEPEARRSIRNRRLARRARGVGGEVGNVDHERRTFARHLHKTHRARGQRKHERRLRKRGRTKQRLDVEPVRHPDTAREPVG
jgi:hypothetical protein